MSRPTHECTGMSSNGRWFADESGVIRMESEMTAADVARVRLLIAQRGDPAHYADCLRALVDTCGHDGGVRAAVR